LVTFAEKFRRNRKKLIDHNRLFSLQSIDCDWSISYDSIVESALDIYFARFGHSFGDTFCLSHDTFDVKKYYMKYSIKNACDAVFFLSTY